MNGAIYTHGDRLSIPMKRKKPTVYAVWNDLMHEAVPDSFIGKTLSTILGLPHHTFLILTKRAERMADITTRFYKEAEERGLRDHDHIWHGLTVCNQQEMEDKGKDFFSVPGNKFLSLEPLLSKVIIPPWVIEKKLLSAVILGGETGPGARPMHPDWARSVRDQCAAAGVPFFFKQWGEWVDFDHTDCDYWNHRTDRQRHNLKQVFIDGEAINRVGRKIAGRLLDGKEYNELPWVNKC